STMAFAGTAFASLEMPTGFKPGEYTFIPAASSVSDLKNADGTYHWAKSQIQNMINLGAVKGYPDGTFQPEKPVTRAELASAMANAMFLPKGEEVELPDVSSTHWAAKNIATSLPYLAAFPDGSFRPNAPITREEVAVAIVKAAGLDKKVVDPTILDVVFKDYKSVSPELRPLVAVALDQKLILGVKDADGKLNVRAQDLVTRAEMAYLMDTARTKIGLGYKVPGGSEE
ncbi:MAG: S-layer homology domain-containing protein, partial [Firmicutes bacterium]|nr:S-layer homology domain-containing protein [Bacillota bacterium]